MLLYPINSEADIGEDSDVHVREKELIKTQLHMFDM